MRSDKKKILLFTDWYYPGYKAGGPIQSCFNLVKTMAREFSFYVITSDRDLGDEKAYPEIEAGKWLEGINGERVIYLDNNKTGLGLLRRLIRELNPDLVYFNSMFSMKYTILPRLALKSIRFQGKIVLAPRGMLHMGAMGLKANKKKVFLRAFRLMKLQKKVKFHATDEQEIADIKKTFPGVEVGFAENIPHLNDQLPVSIEKKPGQLWLVFISRIHPKKNLIFLLRLLNKCGGNTEIVLDIYGGLENTGYETECRHIAATAPVNVKIRFMGPLPNQDVFNTLANYHAFALPTLGENFGHAIFEALISGRPVLISDQTPWRNLALQQAGWDLSLEEPDMFKNAIEVLLAMNQQEYDEWTIGARAVAMKYIQSANYKEKYLSLFS